jgi:predicted anti-sigma-YlaC factor YlaD
MKNECSIIRDILPLYVENMVSEDTSEFVKEHLESCPACRAELEKLREPVEVQTEPQPDMDAAPLKRLKKALLMKKVQTILCTAAVLLALIQLLKKEPILTCKYSFLGMDSAEEG